MDIRSETGEIELAGEKFTISALSLDQLQLVLPALERMVVAKDSGERIKEARAIIAATTGKSDAELGAMKISLPELLGAVAAIAKVSGLEDLGKKKPAADSAATPPATA